MSWNFNLVKNSLLDLDLKIADENESEELVLVEDEEKGMRNFVVGCEPPIVVFEQRIVEVPNDLV